ncbi:unnamed protein product [Linum trigynum]|uniref:30S ribosomal protein 3, chloroplastic n=1 Tax=Linum trigynum TaxID=586398 RepID=A0AAV2GC08_9ROSI
MLPAAIQSGANGASPFSCSLLHQTPTTTTFKSTALAFSKPCPKRQLSSALDRKRFSAFASPETVAAPPSEDEKEVEIPQSFDKINEVVVNQMTKPRLVLKFIWMEKNIGLGLDQVIPGHGTVPLSPYFFWPRKDAWEELKTTLESKPWISQKKMIILLNQATDIINLWQQSGGNLTA